MGRVNIVGLGTVDIEGDTPSEKELEVFKRIIETKKANQLTEPAAEEATESFMNSAKFGRILTEVGLSIAGSVATGGLALPGLALRAGMLARPFLTQLAKASVGSGIGGGTGAVVAQAFDPKEDVIKEILRASTEGALGEALGAPLVIKGGQVVSKLLSSKNPQQFDGLLEGAKDAENALKEASKRVLKNQKIIEDPNSSKEAIKQANDFFNGLDAPTKKARSKLIQSAVEIAEGGLTPGVKSSNRTLEIIENISQKSLLGGGAISRRYEAATDLGNVVAKDVLDQFKVTADEEQLGELFLSALSNSRQTFKAAKNSMYKAVDEIVASEIGKERIIPVANPLKKAFQEIEEIYSEDIMPDQLANLIRLGNRNIELRSGNYSFSELQKLREAVTNVKFELRNNGAALNAATKLQNTVDELFKSDAVPDAARTALEDANKFFNTGQDIFDRGITSQLLKQAANDGMLDGKSAKAIQNVFKLVAGGDNVASTRKLFDEIDAMTGKTIAPRVSSITGKQLDRGLKPILDPDTGKPLLTQKEADLMKQSFRGQFITNALRASEEGGQFGSFYNAKKFANNLAKGEQKLKNFLFKGADKKALDELENTLNFAQGDLSRLTGLPGGIFIQMKQAGAAGSVLQMASPAAITGGQVASAGLAAGFLGALPAITILAAPAVATRVLLNPKFQNLMFKEPVKNIIKATNMSKEEFLGLSAAEQKRILSDEVVQNKISKSMNATYRQIIGRMLSDGLITKQEADDNLAKVNQFERGQAPQQRSALPEVRQSSFPVIERGVGTGGPLSPGAATALASGDLDAAIAANQSAFSEGGIASVRRK